MSSNPFMVRERIRIRFSKTGNLCFIGHRDLLTTLERLFRRARLPIAMSEGFRPKLRMSSPSALPLGVAGENEVLELEFSEPTDPDSLLITLNKCAVDGLLFKSARLMDAGEKKAFLCSSVYELVVPAEFRAEVARCIDSLLDASTFPVVKTNGKTVDLRPSVLSLAIDTETGVLTTELRSESGPEAGVRELLGALQLGDQMFKTIFPVRKKCLLSRTE